jgi:zinc/manganese transport system substrate-binding protein
MNRRLFLFFVATAALAAVLGSGVVGAPAAEPMKVSASFSILGDAWQSLANGKIYVANIRDALIAADPEGKATYEANAQKFLDSIAQMETKVKEAIAKLPPERRKIITTHDAFGYFGAAYGLEFIAPEDVSTESEATAKDVAKIITQIKKEKIPAVFLENVTDRRLLDQIAKETGAKIGGTLFSDALSPPDGPAGTYLDMFRNNIETMSATLSS